MLIVVDMQAIFSPAKNRRTIKNVKREITNARKRREHIVIVEGHDCGPTLRGIKTLAKRVGAVFVTKKGQDGSTVIFNAFKGHAPKRIRVCGVLTDQCVASTAGGLARKYPSSTVVVVGDACNSYRGQAACLPDLPTHLSNVKFVRTTARKRKNTKKSIKTKKTR